MQYLKKQFQWINRKHILKNICLLYIIVCAQNTYHKKNGEMCLCNFSETFGKDGKTKQNLYKTLSSVEYITRLGFKMINIFFGNRILRFQKDGSYCCNNAWFQECFIVELKNGLQRIHTKPSDILMNNVETYKENMII